VALSLFSVYFSENRNDRPKFSAGSESACHRLTAARVHEKIPGLTATCWDGSEVDLDQRLYFAKCPLLLTSDQLVCLGRKGLDRSGLYAIGTLTPQSTANALKVVTQVSGTLELRAASESIASWRFTFGLNEQAQALLDIFSGLSLSSAGTCRKDGSERALLNEDSPPEKTAATLAGQLGTVSSMAFCKTL
jgi:hypothetical protein